MLEDDLDLFFPLMLNAQLFLMLHCSFFFRNGLPVFKELKYLSEVKRFSMAVMFLSDKDKTGE